MGKRKTSFRSATPLLISEPLPLRFDERLSNHLKS